MTTFTQMLSWFEEDHMKLPKHKIVCPRCDGDGTHTNPAIDGNGITQSDRDDWADDEFMDDYRRGVYNIRCEECDGRNVIDEIDAVALARTPELESAWEEWLKDWYESEAEMAAERRMGC